MTSYYALDHQAKSRLLTNTLEAAGYERGNPRTADVVLVDIDDPDAPRRKQLVDQASGLVLLYPHGGMPSTYHGFYQPLDGIDVQLVHGPGGARLARRLNTSRQIVEVGWSYSPSLPFRPTREVRRVLFGPIHPYGSGKLPDSAKAANGRVYESLSDTDLDLTVQMFGTPEQNGLPDRMKWTPSSLVLDWLTIDEADLVIAEGTLACLALARGKPVVMFGQSLPLEDEHNRPAEHTLIRVPSYAVDFDDGPLEELFHAACSGAGQDWKDEFVGGPFDKTAFLEAVSRVPVAA